MSISKQTIDRIKEESIVDVISEHLTLKKSGQQFIGLCPFHNEKTPSFNVNPKGYFKCFGCGAGGDAITFLMKVENIPFHESIKKLATRFGVPYVVDERTRHEEELKDSIYAVYRDAETHFYSWLKSRRNIGDHLHSRVSENVIDSWKLGFSEPGRLFESLSKEKGHHPDVLLKSGLVRKTDWGRYYDFFEGRIMIPIRDNNGRVIAFAGRSIEGVTPEMEGRKTPKYINTPESPVFRKSDVLFGLDRAHKSIKESGRAILVEGYFDAIALHEYGITNSVAVTSTSVTHKHIDELKRIASEVVICFDGDEAGINAAKKAGREMAVSGLPVSVMSLEGDPDEFLKKNGDKGFNLALESRLDLLGFAMNAADLDNPNPDLSYSSLSSLYEVIDSLEDPAHKHEWIRKIAKRMGGTNPNVIIESYNLHLKKRSRGKSDSLDECVLGSLMLNPLLRRSAEMTITPEDFSAPIHGLFYEFLVSDKLIVDAAIPNSRLSLEEEIDGQILITNHIRRGDVLGEFKEFCAGRGMVIQESEMRKLEAMLVQTSDGSHNYLNLKQKSIYEKRLKILESKIKGFRREGKRQECDEALDAYTKELARYDSFLSSH